VSASHTRRELLREVVQKTPVLLSEPLAGRPADIERASRRLGLEGTVAKRRDSRYEAGKRSHAWIKVKFSRRQEFVVGGYKPADYGFDSLLVGYFEGRRLHYAGKVRAGFTPHLRAEMFQQIVPLQVPRCPFVNLPSGRTGHWGEGVTAEQMPLLRWLRPALVVEVAFTEWTRDGNLRHTPFVGVRSDKSAREVGRDEPPAPSRRR
jgi:bifunctional non-homologous end joining protein LigD